MKVLILGDGLLGSELVKQTGWDYISRKKDGIDFIDIQTYKHFLSDYDEVINCIAYTDTYGENREKHWDINYKAVANLVDICNGYEKKLIHISTDYLYTHSKEEASEEDVPVHCGTWYGYTKLLADGYVQLKSNDYLIVRGTHKKKPFIYDNACVNQIGNFDYADKISDILISLIENDVTGVYNIGTELKSIYDLAKYTKADVTPINKKFNALMPTDVSMNVTKLNNKLREINDKK